ncbi:MAG: hypothetical protein WC832_01485 [Anaerolineales bacterium]
MYDVSTFLNRMSALDYKEILVQGDLEVRRMEEASFSKKGSVKRRNDGSVDYVRFIKGFLFFLRYCKKPVGISDSEFQKFRKVIEALVVKNQLKPEVLELFE